MTTEDDFRRALNAEPDNFTLRLVFADWLEEQGDERALGYRALGYLKLTPWYFCGSDDWGWWNIKETNFLEHHLDNWLPSDWWKLVGSGTFSTMLENLDTAARAFLKLPPERQQELLAQPVLCGGEHDE